MAGLLAVALGFASGYLSLVETFGNSMAPRMAAGDLVIVRQASYGVGDVVAYHSEDLKQVVLHRVIGVEGDRFSFQGDNNDFIDPEEPARRQLFGKELLHIPQGGVWLDRLTSPTALGLLAFAAVATGGAAGTRRSRRRSTTMSQHSARTRPGLTMPGLPAWGRRAGAAAGLVGVAGLALGAAAWTTPATSAPGTAPTDPGEVMTFSYSADVPRSPAYDDTTVTSPDPVFRRLTDTVEITYSYRGAPGAIAVVAELSTSSGWHSTVPLAPSDKFHEGRYTGAVTLDLNTIERRAQAAAEATGIPTDQVAITVVPTVTTAGDETFAPELALALTPLQLTLAGDESTLTAGGPPVEAADVPGAPSIGIADLRLPVSTGRTLSLLLVLCALLAAAGLALLGRLSAPATEAAAIHRRYAQMLVEVEPMPTPVGRPVIDVVDFTTLAKLAQRYELLVLHWSRSDVETFIVQDHATTYRYRSGTGHPRPTPRLVASKA